MSSGMTVADCVQGGDIWAEIWILNSEPRKELGYEPPR